MSLDRLTMESAHRKKDRIHTLDLADGDPLANAPTDPALAARGESLLTAVV